MTLQERFSRAWRTAWASPFWRWFVLIFVGAAVLRLYRIDMPPFDYPSDRQRNNLITIDALLNGASLFGLRKQWFELWILPWLAARTYGVGRLLGADIWTWARIWSALAGLATVAMAAWVGFFAAGGLRPMARRRLALLFMGALAINPYHLVISRLISTESVTLALQMAAVGCYFTALAFPAKKRWWILLFMFFVLACWSKVPSIIWVPGICLGLLGAPTVPPRMRLGAAAMVLVAALAGFAMIGVNPLRFFDGYMKAFPATAGQARQWVGSELWTWSYASRVTLMLSLPGVLLALIGFLRAPWLFRLTMLTFLVLFYPLTNLNTYNFCHAIIPGMALAAWGTDMFLAAAAGTLDRHGFLRRRRYWAARLNLSFGGGLLALMIMILYRLGPENQNPPVPRGEIRQAVEVIRERVPTGTIVKNDDMEGMLFYLLGQGWDSMSTGLDLSTGWYYGIDRVSDTAIRRAADGWVAWTSLPGEPGGVLYTKKENAPRPMSGLLEVTTTTATARFFAPSGYYDAETHLLRMTPNDKGTTFRIGIDWQGTPPSLAGMRWLHRGWGRHVAVPLREGGISFRAGGVLSVTTGTTVYSFEIPNSFAPGRYGLEVFPLDGEKWAVPESGIVGVPFDIEVLPAAQAELPLKIHMTQTWLMEHDIDPKVWDGAWLYRWMNLQGYRFDDRERFLVPCPGMQAGTYRFSVRGEGTPAQHPDWPGGAWPKVDVYLPGNPAPAGVVTLDDRETGRFDVTITAALPFDSIMLLCRSELGTRSAALPWMPNFRPVESGKQTMTIRGIELMKVDRRP